ncbi:hypothetical protein N0V88_003556 [Collariella sp. IMI 366227]|nr:hypothetical protein N0V88_003556 [Collariella sp. IMI 366227]
MSGAMYNPVVIDDDDHLDNFDTRRRRIEEETQTGIHLAQWVAARRSSRVVSGRYATTLSLTEADTEEAIENVLIDGIAEVIDLTDDDTPATCSARQFIPQEEETIISGYEIPGLRLRPGINLELNSALGEHKIQFLRIKYIVQRPSGVVLRGWGFARTRYIDGVLPRLNEVAMVAELRTSDSRHGDNQGLVDVPLSNVRRARELRITSAPFPEHRFDQYDFVSLGKQWMEEYGPLVCRYSYHVHYHGDNVKPCEWAIIRINETEADNKYTKPDQQNRFSWRGETVPGGSHIPGVRDNTQPVVDLEAGLGQRTSDYPQRLAHGQRYTAGDVFAGAGGASRGIERARVRLVFAVDHWSHAAATLRSNFPGTKVYHMPVDENFLGSESTRYRVDILHLSPPCQFWSPAHTVAGKDDEANKTILFSSAPLVKKYRPRLFTLEQTFGLLSPKFKESFKKFLKGFNELGCSIRWKVTPLANYGVPQLRKRLLIIGSCPGEKLPTFPAPTHGKDVKDADRLLPWATPKSVLASISGVRNNPLHQPHAMRRFNPPKAPWDPTKLARTITTSGGQNYHWDGKRDFTLLEYAKLQGFPRFHKFEGSCIKKQIGNAFAPSVVKVLYEHLVNWLLDQDGIRPSDGHQPFPGAVDAIDLSQDDDTVFSGDEGSDADEEIIHLGDRSLHHGPRELAQSFCGQSSTEGSPDSLMDLEFVSGLSDLETVRGDYHRTVPDYNAAPVIDLTLEGAESSWENQCVI